MTTKQRLGSIIKHCTESKADSATILEMLRSWRDEIKEPVREYEAGYLGRSFMPDDDEAALYPRLIAGEMIRDACDEKGVESDWPMEDWPPLKVKMVIEDDE